MIKIAVKSLFIAFILTASLWGKPEIAKKVKSTRSITGQDISDLGRSIIGFPRFIGTLAHEYGHALGAKLLTGYPMDIHIGAQPEKMNKKIGKIGCLTLENFKSGGYSYIGYPERKHLVPIVAAGPALGILSLVGIRILINKLQESLYLTPYKVFLRALIDSELLYQALYGFTPLYNKTTDGDGARIWHALGADDKTIQHFLAFDRKSKLPLLPYVWHAMSYAIQ